MPATPTKPPVYGKPEPRHWRTLVAFWVFMLVSLVVIVWLLVIAKPMKPLVCDRDNVPLTQFGTCHDD